MAVAIQVNFAGTVASTLSGEPTEDATMGLMDLLDRYAGHDASAPAPAQATEDFGRVAQQATPEALSGGIEQAFRSDATPAFERMVGQLFERSDGSQRAGLLNEILGSFGAESGVPLGGLLRRAGVGGTVSPSQAQEVPVTEVENAAAEAARQNPGIIERVSRFYAQHPQLVQTLGNAALTIAMTQMARRRRG